MPSETSEATAEFASAPATLAARSVASRLVLPVLGQPLTRARALRLRSLAGPAARSFSALEACRLCLQLPLSLLAGLVVYDGLRGPPIGGHESGRRPSLDSLAWTGGPGIAGGGQRFLHGVSLHAAADARAALAAAGPELAALVAEQMAGGRLARRCFSGLTRRLLSGTARGGRPGSFWPILRLLS